MEEVKNEIYEQDVLEAVIEEKRIADMERQGYVKCDECNCWVEDTTNGICESCIDDIIEKMTIDETIKYAENNEDEFVLFTEYFFSKEQVIEILKDHLQSCDEKMLQREKRDYLENDIYHLLDYLQRGGKI